MALRSSHPTDRGGLPKTPSSRSARARTVIRRQRIIDAASRRFAAYGYEDVRMQDVAQELGIAKGSIFQYFGSKKGVLLEALRSNPVTHLKYLDAPPQILREGFFAVIRYWLEWIDHLSKEERVGFGLWLVANYGAGLDVKREISRLFRTEDPAGVLPFVRLGVERGEVRDDLDVDLIARTVDILVHAFEEAGFAEGIDHGLFRKSGGPDEVIPDRVDQYLELIRSAIGKR